MLKICQDLIFEWLTWQQNPGLTLEWHISALFPRQQLSLDQAQTLENPAVSLLWISMMST